MIKLMVGLGNPGPEYEDTRHNAGFWWVDGLARGLKVTLLPDKAYHGLVARANHAPGASGPIWLLEPMTYMNLSGKSVAALRRLYAGDLDSILARALAKRPADRYAGAEAFADDSMVVCDEDL